MRVIFRVDASLLIGSGHVMRCLTLADELRQRGTDIVFVCREHPRNMIGFIEAKGFPVRRLPQPEVEYIAKPDDVHHAAWLGVPWQLDASDTLHAVGKTPPRWLIIDHYAVDCRWEAMLRPHVQKIMVIDDLADRCHDCDLLLDQNLYHGMETRYDALLHESCEKLLGPKYALLRPEFAAARKKLRRRDGNVRRVLVFFGGVDPGNETGKTLQALASMNDRRFDVDVVVGLGNPHKEQIQEICVSNWGFNYHCQVDNMAELMATADVAIGAGGATTWERCSLGLPSISVVIADNQYETTKAVEAMGATIYAGYHNEVTGEDLVNAVGSLIHDSKRVKAMEIKSFAITGSELSSTSKTVNVLVGDKNVKS